MVSRGDFGGSYFVELQMTGEPLLHPQLGEIIKIVKSTGVKIGLSTNGLLIEKQLAVIKELDTLTISVDSVSEDYEKIRVGGNQWRLFKGIESALSSSPRPVIDLQVIDFHGTASNLPSLITLAKERQWDVICRSVPDCFAAYHDEPYPKDRLGELCLNPWLSVSVHWEGTVSSCCFDFGGHNNYGNLHQQSLKDIWNTSVERKELMVRQRAGVNQFPCTHCYMRSPALFHLRMLQADNRASKNPESP